MSVVRLSGSDKRNASSVVPCAHRKQCSGVHAVAKATDSTGTTFLTPGSDRDQSPACLISYSQLAMKAPLSERAKRQGCQT